MMSQLRIFLSYTRADERPVKQLYAQLQAAGFAPWMDTEDLLPGQKFEYHIRKAIRASDLFLACLSANSVSRRGVIQREIGEALDILQEKLDEDIFVIPVRLEPCEVPERLREFHWANLYDPQGLPKLLQAIRTQMAQQQPEPQGGDLWTDRASGIAFVWIPPGRFWMGQTEAEKRWLIQAVGKENYQQYYADELPRHEVQLATGFWLGKYAVTQAQWQAVMGRNPSHFHGADRPVECVSWNNTQAFLQKLNALTPPPSPPQQGGVQPTPSPSGRVGVGLAFRLPSEAEWEYACRAGSATIWYFGDDPTQLPTYAWNGKNSDGETHPVGQLPPNAWGLYDMYGNVWEWCADTYHGNYTGAPANGSAWGILGDEKVKLLRGGSWNNNAINERSSNRNRNEPDNQNNNIGLRVVVGAR